jgi:serine/threonine protein kinase
MPTLVRQLDPRVTTLREILDASAPLPIADSVAIVAQVACQLASTHEDGGIHGDVRPAAILIRREPSNPQAIGEVQLAAPRSQAGNRTNAPEYRSPEQIRGEKIDPRTDVFALGLVFYEMLTGRLLRSGAEPSLPSELNPDVPPELDGLVLAMLDKNPRRRLPTAGIAVRDLLRINSQLQSQQGALLPTRRSVPGPCLRSDHSRAPPLPHLPTRGCA